MRFLKLLKKKLAGKKNHFWIFVVLSALSAALILAVLNMALFGSNSSKLIYAVVFIILLAAFVFVQYKILNMGWETTEEIADEIRNRLATKILNADLMSLEKIGDREIYERLTSETTNISQSAGFLIPSLQSVILLFFVLIYLAVLFPVGMVVFTVLIIAGLYLYRVSSKGTILLLKRATASEVRFYGFVNDIIKGFKEIKFSIARKSELLKDIKATSSFLRKLKQKSYSNYSDLTVYSQAFFFLVIGVFVFIVPRFEPASNPMVVKLITTSFFIMAPAIGILFMLPMFENIDLSLEFLQDMEKKLDSITEETAGQQPDENPAHFEKLDITDLTYEYTDKNNGGFKIGPVNISINKGEIVFFTGGNGSGKTTLLKVISSLYKKTGGEVYLNDQKVNDDGLEKYRNNFSGIFSDFHLFSKLYGFEKPDKEKINELLTLMKIENKTAFSGSAFTKLDLSTGQKKRLALVVALLEDRPVMIFDEWAAEQDQYFRDFYYTEILPELKRKGKTVLVVSHDERYFGTADKVIRMDFGKVIEIKTNKSSVKNE